MQLTGAKTTAMEKTFHNCLKHLEPVGWHRRMEQAIHKLKNGKASGASGVLSEMLKAVTTRDEFLDLLI